MQHNSLNPTFTHQNNLQYSLTCTLLQNSNNNLDPNSKKISSEVQTQPQYQAQVQPQNINNYFLNMHLLVPTDTFPKIYTKNINQQYINTKTDMYMILQNVINLYRTLKDSNNIQVNYNSGVIRVKYGITIGEPKQKQVKDKEKKCKYLQIKLDRSLENELDQIRNIISQKTHNIGDFQYFQNRIEKLWKRQEENEKIYLKFKEEVQCRIEETIQRMSIQNTKITLIQEDLHQLLIAFNKLSNIVCPIFTKINIMSEWTTQFILQDKKVMYTGDAGIWTQILFKNQLSSNGNRKFEISFKIVNSRKCNIIAGITAPTQSPYRSSVQASKGEKVDRKFIGLSGTGHLYVSGNSIGVNIHSDLNEVSKNLLNSRHDSQKVQKSRERSKSKQKHGQEQRKSTHQITVTSPTTNSMKSSIVGSQKHKQLQMHSSSVNSHPSHLHQIFKPMQIIKMCIQFEKEKDRIYWKNGNKVLMQARITTQFKNEPVVPYFEFCDTGDAIQFIDI